jgi:hypothetical protein
MKYKEFTLWKFKRKGLEHRVKLVINTYQCYGVSRAQEPVEFKEYTISFSLSHAKEIKSKDSHLITELDSKLLKKDNIVKPLKRPRRETRIKKANKN